MNILYFDCFSGISGDMAVAAMLDLEPANLAHLNSQLKTLKIAGWALEAKRCEKMGILANHIKFDLSEHTHDHDHAHRNFADIVHIIDESQISDRAKELSKAIFGRIATAEAKIHGTSPELVNFHEVGALDSILDIVGASILADLLCAQYDIGAIFCSPVSDGRGFVRCQHGTIPVPAPATVEIFANSQISLRQLELPHELATPTGAAIVSELAGTNGPLPEIKPIKTGYGAGTKDLEIPNVLRVVLGEAEPKNFGEFGKIGEFGKFGEMEDITVIETNIDDCSPEILGYTMERLFLQGAKDVFFAPIYMKKNRPATLLTVLCESGEAHRLLETIFSETTTIGLRMREERRICLRRGSETIKTEYGDLKVKTVELFGEKRLAPEYEEAKNLAKKANVPLHKIYESIKNI